MEKLQKKLNKFISESLEYEPFWYDNIRKARVEAEEKARKEERERIDKIECPLCKSTDKEHVIKSDSNGVYGPGHSSWILDQYFVCKKCGVMYKDIDKLKKL